MKTVRAVLGLALLATAVASIRPIMHVGPPGAPGPCPKCLLVPIK
ncbi:MAG TPA: hypothetical protein VK638_44970 [Edaphobacter sp.]|nr:hypothetical protein [Edaphobacter sp.]